MKTLSFQHLGTCGSMRPVRIRRLELNHVGPFVEASIDFAEKAARGPGELVLFEGPNGSGKTTILQSIAALIADIPEHYKEQDRTPLPFLPELRVNPNPMGRPVDSLRERVPRHPEGLIGHITAVVEHDGGEHYISYRTNFIESVTWRREKEITSASRLLLDAFRASRMMHPRVEWAAFMYGPHMATSDIDPEGPVRIYDSPLSNCMNPSASVPSRKNKRDDDDTHHSSFRQMLVNLRHERLMSLGRAQENPEKSDHYTAIARSRKESLDRLEVMLSRILEKSIRFIFDEEYEYQVDILFDGSAIPVRHLGEGMRSTFEWVSDLLIRLLRVEWANSEISPWDQEFWLILDEIEESLHPNRQAKILPAIREMFPNARIYATTHSPFVVASAGEGTVVPIRPGNDSMVRGEIQPRALEHGQSLEWVIREVFQAYTGFVDQQTRDDLDAHDLDVRSLQKKKDIDWAAFMERRERLMALNDEVRTVVAMQEVPVRSEVRQRLIERADKDSGES